MGATHNIFSDDSQGNGPLYIFDVNSGRDIFAAYDDGSEVFAIMSDGFLRTTSGWKAREVGIGLGDFAADNDAYTYPLLRCKHDVTITDVNVGCDAAVTANGTNYQTLYLEQTGNSTDVASYTTASTGFSIHVPRAFTIVTTANQDHLAAGDTLSLRAEKTASGVAMTGVNVSVSFTIDQPTDEIGTDTDNVFRFVNDIGTAGIWGADTVQRDFLVVRDNGNDKLRIDSAGKMHGTCADQYYYQVCTVGQLVTGDTGSKISPLWAPHCNVKIVNAYIGASDTVACDSNTNFWQLKLTDGTNILADTYIEGPYGGGTALTKGYLYDMGDINPLHGAVTSSEKLALEYTQTGTGSTINGITVVLVYQKTA